MAGRASLIAAAFLLLLAIVARADWTITSSKADKGAVAGLEHRRVAVTNSETGDEATVDMALFSAKSANVRVIDNPAGDELAAVVRRVRGLAGVNGGYFDPQNAPVGLLVADGKMAAPLRKARLLSGVLVAAKGRVELVRSSEYSSRKTTTGALQCGPFLVDGGTAVPGLNTTRAARRTFVLTVGSDRAALGFCSPVTLAQLGDILVAINLNVRRALNLDGGSSSAFWFAGEEGVLSIPEQKTVRDFVIVTPK